MRLWKDLMINTLLAEYMLTKKEKYAKLKNLKKHTSKVIVVLNFTTTNLRVDNNKTIAKKRDEQNIKKFGYVKRNWTDKRYYDYVCVDDIGRLILPNRLTHTFIRIIFKRD